MPSLSAMQQEVYLAIYASAPTGGGAGTWDSPYDAGRPNPSSTPAIDASNAALFDGIMNDPTKIVSPNLSIRLLPGRFATKGYCATDSLIAWSVKDRMRISGSGMEATTLAVVAPAGGVRYAISNDFTSLDNGFELSDLTIDCALINAPLSSSIGAVRVRGKNVLIRRVKVINYGTNVSSSALVSVITAAGDGSENCAITECSLDVPDGFHTGIAQGFAFEGSTTGHRFCTIRNCALIGIPSTSSNQAVTGERLRGISPGLGLGTVIEGNQIASCAVGLYSAVTAKDIVVWNNYFGNVSMGVWLKNNTGLSVGRVILEENIVELCTYAGCLAGETAPGSSQAFWQTGLCLNTTGSVQSFDQALMRKNIVRDVQGPLTNTPNLRAIRVQRCGQFLAENNVISNIAEYDNTTSIAAVYGENCTARKFFNNEDQGGRLIRGYGPQRVLELQDAVDDVLLAL